MPLPIGGRVGQGRAVFDPFPEFSEATAEAAPQLGELLGTEYGDKHQQDDRYMKWIFESHRFRLP